MGEWFALPEPSGSKNDLPNVAPLITTVAALIEMLGGFFLSKKGVT